jgi:hypothetical protein
VPHSSLTSRYRKTPDKNLKKCHRHRKADPAKARDIDARGKVRKICLSQRKMQQATEIRIFSRRNQNPAHLGSRSPKFEKVFKIAQLYARAELRRLGIVLRPIKQ